MAQSTLTTSPAKQVIVVGSGLAGLSAASQLIAHNVPVHMLERSAKPGGNSIKASSGINGAPTKYQPIPDSKFYDDTVKSAGLAFTSADTTLQRQKLVLTLTESSSNAVNWLIDEKGIDLRTVAQLGGHSLPRTHRGSGQLPPGAAIVTKLSSDLKASPLYQLSTSSIVTKVLKTGDEVTGVEYTSEGEVKPLNGPVIFASGGFGGDAKGLLAKYRPDLANLPSTNEPRPGSQDLLTSVGAQLLDMELVQVHPTSFVDPKDTSNPLKFLAAELLRGEGGLLLREGKRFVDELQTRSFITDVIMNGPADEIYETGLRLWDVFVVLDEGCYAAAKSHIDFYLWKGLMVKTTISKLKHAEEALKSIQEFADVATSRGGEKKDRFGRSAFANWKLRDVEPESVVYVGRVTPAIHFTMGGVVFNEKAQVLDSQGNHIRGLWAAGEVTGGVHGDNRLGGSSLLECVVFGRVAGDQAAGAFEAVKA